jgi:transcription-repair coupling factor (superfamily II helicase)
VIEELIDRYGPLPEPALRLVAMARLRLLCREFGVTEVTTAGTTLRLAPLVLADSQQLRLKRLYPSARYRATASAVQVPIPRAGTGVAAERIRDLDLVQMVADLVAALVGNPGRSADITKVSGLNGASDEGV